MSKENPSAVYEKNFDKLFAAAASGTDNSLSELYADILEEKKSALTKIANARSGGADLTESDKRNIHEQAKEWVTTTGLRQLKHGITASSDHEDGLVKAEKAFDVYNTFEERGVLAGIFKLFSNFKDWAFSRIEAMRSDESFEVIYARRKSEGNLKAFAEKNSINVAQFLEEVKSPSAEAIAILPPPVSVAHEQGNKKGEGNKQEPDHGNAGKSGAGKGHDEVTEVSLGNVGNPLPTSVAMSGNNVVGSHRG